VENIGIAGGVVKAGRRLIVLVLLLLLVLEMPVKDTNH
jgi:hypothetical protein